MGDYTDLKSSVSNHAGTYKWRTKSNRKIGCFLFGHHCVVPFGEIFPGFCSDRGYQILGEK